jgi:hypothetical protein
VKKTDSNPERREKLEPKEENRYPIMVRRWHSKKGNFKTTPADMDDEQDAKESGVPSTRAFTFQKIFVRHGSGGYSKYGSLSETSISSEVDIEYIPLQKLLGDITSCHGWPQMVTKCSAPYKALIYTWDKALAEAESVVDNESDECKQARIDLKKLLEIISSSSGHIRLDQYFKDRPRFIKEKSITHSAFWTLFATGTLIVTYPFPDQEQILSVQSCDEFIVDGGIFRLIAYCYDWNGNEFNRTPFRLKYLTGEPSGRVLSNSLSIL